MITTRRVLDLRGVPRDVLYRAHDHCVVRAGRVISTRTLEPGDEYFGAWGYFRGGGDGHYGETPPVRGRAHGTVPYNQRRCTVLHTTGVHMHAARMIGVPVHHAIARDSTIVLLHHIDAMCWHAHSANRYADGIEISGRATISDAQTVAARELLRHLDDLKRSVGIAPPYYVAPHAFSRADRYGDPGAAVWAAVGAWAIAELGWRLGPISGSGRQPPWCAGEPATLSEVIG